MFAIIERITLIIQQLFLDLWGDRSTNLGDGVLISDSSFSECEVFDEII
jgi:hypothetical protein